MVRATTKAQLDKFRRTTIPASDTLSLAGFQKRFREIGSLSESSASLLQPDLSAHSGPKDLLDFQSEVVSIAKENLSQTRRTLLSLPTGAGKTFTCIRLLFDLLDQGVRSVVWLAPQTLLLDQAEEELRRSWYASARSVGLFIVDHSGSQKSPSPGATIRFMTLQKLIKEGGVDARPDLVIVDEAHHLEENVFGNIVEQSLRPDSMLVGLTATPGRGNTSEIQYLVDIFRGTLTIPRSIEADPIEALKARGVYSSIKHVLLREDARSDLDKIIARRGQALAKSENAALSAARLDKCVHQMMDARNEASIVFCHSLAHVIVVWAALSENGINAGMVGSEFGKAHNLALTEKFRRGDVQCIVNVKYAAVGADFPSANAAYITVPVSSPIFFEQAVGRVARGPAVGGTADARVYDFDDHFSKFGRVQSYSRFLHAW